MPLLTNVLAEKHIITEDVYLDYAAATPMDSDAVSEMMPYLSELFYNPSAPYAKAREAKEALDAAKERLAHTIGARAENIVLTAGATEANNIALVTGSALGEIACDEAEHDSVRATVLARGGKTIAIDSAARVDLDDLAQNITPDLALISIELANGELGTIQPLREISELVAKERRRRLLAGEMRPLYLHSDASQAAGHISVNVSSLGADMVTLSAAKIYGPKQVGLLWVKDGIALKPLIFGGGQEGGVRSGTENVAGAVAFAAALEKAERLRSEEYKRERALTERLKQELKAHFPWMQANGPAHKKERLPNILHISFPSLEARRLVILLEDRGVSVGTGSACAASKMQVSHVLLASGATNEAAAGSLRISVGRPTTDSDIAYAIEAIAAAVSSECTRLGIDPYKGA